ncbi:MAG: hypothetical protein FWF69_04235 [Firmicutes bacterium]|nr:hypothetical protein [Bacillota bacterium]
MEKGILVFLAVVLVLVTPAMLIMNVRTHIAAVEQVQRPGISIVTEMTPFDTGRFGADFAALAMRLGRPFDYELGPSVSAADGTFHLAAGQIGDALALRIYYKTLPQAGDDLLADTTIDIMLTDNNLPAGEKTLYDGCLADLAVLCAAGYNANFPEERAEVVRGIVKDGLTAWREGEQRFYGACSPYSFRFTYDAESGVLLCQVGMDWVYE